MLVIIKPDLRMLLIFAGAPFLLLGAYQLFDAVFNAPWHNFDPSAVIICRLGLVLGTTIFGALSTFIVAPIVHKLAPGDKKRQASLTNIMAWVFTPVFCALSLLGLGMSFDNGGQHVSAEAAKNAVIGNLIVMFPMAATMGLLAGGLVCLTALSGTSSQPNKG